MSEELLSAAGGQQPHLASFLVLIIFSGEMTPSRRNQGFLPGGGDSGLALKNEQDLIYGDRVTEVGKCQE